MLVRNNERARVACFHFHMKVGSFVLLSLEEEKVCLSIHIHFIYKTSKLIRCVHQFVAGFDNGVLTNVFSNSN